MVNIAFWLCLATAIGLFLYPRFTEWRAQKEKEELLAMIRLEMLANADEAMRVEAENEETVSRFDSAIELEDNEEEMDALSGEEVVVATGEASEPAATAEELEAQRKSAIADVLSKQTVIGIIEIPEVDILEPVVEGTSKENLKVAAGHVKGTAGIGKAGNCVICGHNGGIYGRLFQDLKKLENGSRVTITDAYNQEFIYEVYDSFTVEPNEVWILEDVEDAPAAEILTLFTCEENGTIRRVLRCRKV